MTQKPRVFTLPEVIKHNTEGDCYTIVHGRVYDVTKYLRLHPGGMSLLYRNAGADSTSDFEAMFHSTKARQILEQYYVGDLKGTPARENATVGAAVKPSHLFASPPIENSNSAPKPAVPRFSQGVKPLPEQKKQDVTVIVDKEATGAPFSINLHAPPADSASSSNSSSAASGAAPEFLQFELKSVKSVTHDTSVFTFQRADSKQKPLRIPVGQHIFVCFPGDGTEELKRPYTPIRCDDDSFDLLVKVYPQGKASRYIHSRKLGDRIKIFGPFGEFQFDKNAYPRIAMLAAGTGITPIYQVLQALFADSGSSSSSSSSSESSSAPQVTLLFSNRTEGDRLLREQLDAIAKQHTSQFKQYNILSKPADSKQCDFSGRLSESILIATLKAALPNASDSKSRSNANAGSDLDLSSPRDRKQSTLFLICGPDEYNKAAVKLLRDAGVLTRDMFVFE